MPRRKLSVFLRRPEVGHDGSGDEMTFSRQDTDKVPVKDQKILRSIADELDNGEKFVLTCHIKPDGDAIGSMLGLGLALMESGRDVVLYAEDPVPELLSFLPGSEHVKNEITSQELKGATLIILDCCEPERIGRNSQWILDEAESIIVIDHHLSESPVCTRESMRDKRCTSYIQHDIFAAGALVLWILQELGWPISKDVATNLYAAIVTDTGSFHHSNTNELTFEMARDLVKHGAAPYYIADKLYQNYPLRRLQLLALVLKTLEVKRHGKIGLLQATPEMFRISGASKEDTEDFVGYARCIDSVEVAIFIKEAHAGQVSVSLRSKSYFNVAKFAREFGGGGHFHAAGFRTASTVPEIRNALLERLDEYFDELERLDG